MDFPDDIDSASFDVLRSSYEWAPAIKDILREHARGEKVTLAEDGTVLVGWAGDIVAKMYPPFMADHFAFERAALEHIGGRLSLPTPQLVAVGDRGGWPFLVMTRLSGRPLTQAWDAFSEAERLAVLNRIGSLAAEVHAQGVDRLRPHAPTWSTFLARQRAGCRERQERTRLPGPLLATLEDFIGTSDTFGEDVILTGEYTPMNLLVEGRELAGMFDFGDGLVGPHEYDWLGPMCFLAAGHRERHAAFLSGYGVSYAAIDRHRLLRLLLLHRYSHLRLQLRHLAWEDAPSLDALARRIWP